MESFFAIAVTDDAAIFEHLHGVSFVFVQKAARFVGQRQPQRPFDLLKVGHKSRSVQLAAARQVKTATEG